MSLWVMKLPPEWIPNAEQRASWGENEMRLPYDGVPDLSGTNTVWEVRQILRQHLPDLTPEANARLGERYQRYVNELHAEDILVVPNPSRKEVCFAVVLGVVRHTPEGYTLAVRWYPRAASLPRFKRFGDWHERGGDVLFEIDNPQLRTALRDQLPLKANRFGKWRWVIGIAIAIQALMMAKQILGL